YRPEVRGILSAVAAYRLVDPDPCRIGEPARIGVSRHPRSVHGATKRRRVERDPAAGFRRRGCAEADLHDAVAGRLAAAAGILEAEIQEVLIRIAERRALDPPGEVHGGVVVEHAEEHV